MRLNYLKRKANDKSAQALVEFSLCMPLVLLIIGIIITVSQLVYAKQVCQAAAYVGCRQYVIERSDQNKQRAIQLAEDVVDYSSMQISVSNVNIPPVNVMPITKKDGSSYKMASCEVTGNIVTMFPVKWDGQLLQPNITTVNGYCTMLVEE